MQARSFLKPAAPSTACIKHGSQQAHLATSTAEPLDTSDGRCSRFGNQAKVCFLLEDATGSPPQIGTLLNLAWKLRAPSLSMLRPALRWPGDRKNLKFAGRPAC